MKERMVVRRNIIDIEAAERDLQVKLYRKVQQLFLDFTFYIQHQWDLIMATKNVKFCSRSVP